MAAQRGEEWGAVGGVFGEFFGAVAPPHFAGANVHPEKSVCWAGRLAPAGHNGAGNDKILKHHRDIRAAPVGGEKTKFLVERTVPQRVAGGSIDCRECAAYAVRKDGVRGRVSHDARPANAFGRHIREIHMKDVLPEFFSSHCI